MNKINILGIGPGSREYVLPITEKIVANSDVLVGGKRALALFKEYQKEEVVITADLEGIKNYIQSNYKNKKISILVSGDTGFHSMLGYIQKHFSLEELEVVPGISSLQLLFARAKMLWQDAYLTSLHGNQDRDYLLKLVKSHQKVALLTDNKFPANRIAEYLLEEGIEHKELVVGIDLSYPSERLVKGSLEEIAGEEFSGLVVVVIYDV